MATEMMTAVLLAPFVCLASALSLSTLQRSMEWVATIAKKPQSDAVLKKLRPAFKTLNNLLDRIFADNKFEMTSTEILLMAIVIMLLCLYMKPSAPVQVNITPQPQPKTDNKEHEQ